MFDFTLRTPGIEGRCKVDKNVQDDGFLEYSNVVTFLHENNIPVVRYGNIRMGAKLPTIETKLADDPVLTGYYKIVSKLAQAQAHQLKLIRFSLGSYEWIYLMHDSGSKLGFI